MKMKKKKYEIVEVNGETIYLRKSVMGLGIIHPIKMNGKIVWKNFIAGGNWWR